MGKGPRVRYPEDVPDGAATTLMLSENIHKDEDASQLNWLTYKISNTDIFGTPEQFYGMVWVASLSPDPQNEQERINRDDYPPADSYVVTTARFARPASAHPEIFISVFAGGNTRSIREDIDYTVYQQLMTPNGRRSVDPKGQQECDKSPYDIQANPPSPPIQRFRNGGALSDSDY